MRALAVGDAVLGDRREDQAFALPQRDVAVAEVEAAREGDLEPFADPEGAVRLDVDGDVRREEREAVRARGGREDERGGRG